jgi:LPS-assembly protein
MTPLPSIQQQRLVAVLRVASFASGVLGSAFFVLPVIAHMGIARNGKTFARHASWLAIFLFLFLGPAAATEPGARPQHRFKAGTSVATLEADQQRQVGKVFYADGHVDIVYESVRLRADHAEYNDETKLAQVHGHVQFDHDTQHLEADDGRYDLRTGSGTFHHVRGTITVQRRPNPTLLISPNPLYFEGEEVTRQDEETYTVRRGWFTVCEPERPKWKFYAARATIRLEHTVRLENATFKFFSVPVVYLPYATAPVGRRVRQSGFLIPEVGDSSSKGFVLGDAFYWAPKEWMDTIVGGRWLSKRGYSQNEEIRLRPVDNVRFDASYYAVHDRGVPEAGDTIGPSQGGHEYHIGLDALLPQGWRTVLDLNGLSSLTFQLAFAESFTQAVNSEVRNTAFVSNKFRGFSLDFAALSYKNFLSTSPVTSVYLRTAPEARFSSVEQAPWQRWPVYFSFDAFAGAVNRSDTVTGFQTPAEVQRTELAPSVTLPLHWGPWLAIVPTFTLRSTRYGGQLQNGVFNGQALVRTTEEFALDLRPPSLARIWQRDKTKWKHAVEPEVTYRYVNGVNGFGRFIRYDEDETLTDTSEVEYGATQRLFRREGVDDAQELVSWRVSQKYFFDPTFGGALVPGQRNVFQALDSLTPFAFADAARRYSPIISDLRITPGGRYDAQFRADYDPARGRFTALGSLLKLKPYRESFITLADFSVVNLPLSGPTPPGTTFEPRSNQVRALVGYGDLNRPGFNGAIGLAYDVTQHTFQNQLVQFSYNGSCCGIGFEYRRFALGNVRIENQYRIVILIANIGSAGNLRRQEKIF